jgi:hypothetical protein
MSMIVYVALLASAFVALRHGPARAMLAVWLPVLLLVPESFRAITPGLPDPTFSQAAMIPLVLCVLLRHGASWRPRPLDLLVVAYAAVVAYSDYSARGYSDAQNLMFGMLFSVVGPYAVARLVLQTEALDAAVARRIVMLLFVAALVGLYEVRFGVNPFQALLRPLFPGQGQGWVTTFRHGLARVAGPYSHAILAGIMMLVAYRLQRWLQWRGLWEPRFPFTLPPAWTKARVITAVLFVGMLMTLARGPWIGAIVAAAIVMVGRARNRRRALVLSLTGVAVGGVVGAALLARYLDVAPGAEMTMSQESAMYRKVLFEEYFSIALDRAWFGWGLTTWPKVLGMPSIDNHWLLLALMHGVLAMALLFTLLLASTVQLVARGLREPAGQASPAFTLAGIFLGVIVAICTVYMGEQVVPMVFFLLGWGQALLARPVAVTARPAAAPGVAPGPATPAPARTGGFRGVIA